MKFFIDTAEIEEIRAASSIGVLDGVTTNPSLLQRRGSPFARCSTKSSRSSTAR